MNDTFVVLTSESLKKITYGIHSLNQEERELVRETFMPYVGRQLWEQDIKRTLHELRTSHKLSALDVEGVQEAFFKGE